MELLEGYGTLYIPALWVVRHALQGLASILSFLLAISVAITIIVCTSDLLKNYASTIIMCKMLQIFY